MPAPSNPKDYRLVEVRARQSEPSLASLLEVVETKHESVKIYDNDKVVAEIIPASEPKYRSQHDPHSVEGEEADTDEYSYKTMGETLLRR